VSEGEFKKRVYANRGYTESGDSLEGEDVLAWIDEAKKEFPEPMRIRDKKYKTDGQSIIEMWNWFKKWFGSSV